MTTRHVQPMLAKLADLPADPDNWAFEVKWDGMRAIAFVSAGGELRLETRNLNDVTAQYPDLTSSVPAALAFGVAHVAGPRMLAFGVWATGMGLVLGGLATATGGLLAPVVAHACYDVLAFQYLGAAARRRGGEGV
mgnify:CR=1 FL=1